MDKNIAVTKIVIKIGDKELELSLEEAKELRDILENAFGKNGIIYYPYTPYYGGGTDINPCEYKRWEVKIGDGEFVCSSVI